MKNCNESTERWPNALVDVSPDEFEEFLDHAESCPYHSAMLREEEEECQAVFRLARGFDSEGRILDGEELQDAIVEYQRQQETWQIAAPQMRVSFKHISLTNRGEDIGSCGKFLAFPKHEGIHELDRDAGLQIWGVISAQDSKKILLGFLSLVDLQHPGEEHFLQLENGYTVGINVEPQSGNRFKIGFRCVENEELRKELLEVTQHKRKRSRAAAAKASGKGNSFSRSLIGKAGEHGRRLITELMSPSLEPGLTVGAACFLVFCLTLTLLIPKPLQTSADSDNKKATEQAVSDVKSPPATAYKSEPGKATDTDAKVTDSQDGSGTEPQTSRAVAHQPSATKEPKLVAKRHEGPAKSLNLTPGYKPSRPESPWLFQSVFDTGTGKDGTLVINSGSDPALREKLLLQFECQLASLMVTNNVPSVLDLHREFRISWSIIRRENSATVEAVLTVDGETKTIAHTSDGTCPEQACDTAVKAAVARVFTELGFEVGEDEKSVADTLISVQ